MTTPGFDVPFLLGMMRLCDSPSLSDPSALADWIEARLDEGLVWFDHADTYGDRRCETLFGEALALRPALKPHVRVVAKAGVVLRSRDSSRFGVKHYDTSPPISTRQSTAACHGSAWSVSTIFSCSGPIR
ncbi:aldo/keto reductase [Modicisalibacter luteus]|uniref:aldo/keto reductase n=1 Tax=Modicisalibacter luteus TaxID=453962 RepID=UPI003645ED0B